MSNKRKRNIEDFFFTANKRPVLPADGDENDCGKHGGGGYHNKLSETVRRTSSTIKTTRVPGLSLHEAFITPAEESNLLSFLHDPVRCTWRIDLSRRTMHFGGTYCLHSASAFSQSAPEPEVLQAPPLPAELDWLLDRFEEQGIYEPKKRPQYCIVENFSFGEPVVGLSLLDDVYMRFLELAKAEEGSVRSGKAAKAAKTGRREDVLLKGRALCVMRGDSRWKWQHEIVRSAKGRPHGWKRISLTFKWKQDG